ncbi:MULTISPECIES: M50 family metallopeptidase [unclassified Paenarthrobacter]|uniref:M50 family metallopeptidase n=1 Tax=unclassified Paenarthrobacter TaxID=2634190 RepID=UPI003CEE6002
MTVTATPGTLTDPTGLPAAWWEAVIRSFTETHTTAVPATALLGIIGCAVALSVPRATWRWFGLYVTFVHELGHAYAALMTGRFVHSLRIGLDHSGRLVSSGRGAFGAAWSGFWGYPAPAVAGLALIWAFTAGRSGAAMSIGAIVLLVSLVFLRNATGILVAVVSAAAAQALLLFGTPEVISYAIMVLGIALTVGSVRDLLKLAGVHTRHRHRLQASDAFILGRTTGVPAFIWLAGMTAVVLACAVMSVLFLWQALAA